ncbi:unnamed protein product [Cyprideis torosa]|uniref:Uncharacterized protein n=1 Tax=Cyprideis torosa TaxID=163714 RepID=A0A7R8W6I4_9CRUS|nr:unnamed protein product [Cyprideis torosa]CAG0886465.1 unnamed protein product [Cyprideis torosa]
MKLWTARKNSLNSLLEAHRRNGSLPNLLRRGSEVVHAPVPCPHLAPPQKRSLLSRVRMFTKDSRTGMPSSVFYLDSSQMVVGGGGLSSSSPPGNSQELHQPGVMASWYEEPVDSLKTFASDIRNAMETQQNPPSPAQGFQLINCSCGEVNCPELIKAAERGAPMFPVPYCAECCGCGYPGPMGEGTPLCCADAAVDQGGYPRSAKGDTASGKSLGFRVASYSLHSSLRGSIVFRRGLISGETRRAGVRYMRQRNESSSSSTASDVGEEIWYRIRRFGVRIQRTLRGGQPTSSTPPLSCDEEQPPFFAFQHLLFCQSLAEVARCSEKIRCAQFWFVEKPDHVREKKETWEVRRPWSQPPMKPRDHLREMMKELVSIRHLSTCEHNMRFSSLSMIIVNERNRFVWIVVLPSWLAFMDLPKAQFASKCLPTSLVATTHERWNQPQLSS